jgi:hypothetical protein
VVAVLDADGKIVMETIVATEAAAIILKSLRGPRLHVTLSERVSLFIIILSNWKGRAL